MTLAFNPTTSSTPNVNLFDKNEFRALDFQRADFEKLNYQLSLVDWHELRSSCVFEEYPSVFTKKLHEVCLAEVPLKKPPTGQPRCYNTLRRKKAKLKKRLSAARLGSDSNRIRELEDQIAFFVLFEQRH